MAEPPSPSSSEPDSLASLPDSASSDDIDSDDGLKDAEREWKESLQQLELLLTMVVVPYMGKYFGRKCAYWGKSPCGHYDVRMRSWRWKWSFAG